MWADLEFGMIRDFPPIFIRNSEKKRILPCPVSGANSIKYVLRM